MVLLAKPWTETCYNSTKTSRYLELAVSVRNMGTHYQNVGQQTQYAQNAGKPTTPANARHTIPSAHHVAQQGTKPMT